MEHSSKTKGSLFAAGLLKNAESRAVYIDP